MTDWKKFRKEYYKQNCAAKYDNGYILFTPDSMSTVERGSFKTYDEYLEVQRASVHKSRKYFELCYFVQLMYYDFKGQIARFDKAKGKVLFRRIMIDGMYMDGIGFYGKEDHVWMDMEPFKDYKPEDCLSFEAEVYRYMKLSKGKLIDFGLRNATTVKKIDSYAIPTDEALIDQQIEQLVCETCRFYDHCYMEYCIADSEERQARFELLKSLEPGKFSPLTVMLAYELEYRIFLQTGGLKLDKNDKNYQTMLKFAEICASQPVYYVGDIHEAFAKMMCPDKPRMYVEEWEDC